MFRAGSRRCRCRCSSPITRRQQRCSRPTRQVRVSSCRRYTSPPRRTTSARWRSCSATNTIQTASTRSVSFPFILHPLPFFQSPPLSPSLLTYPLLFHFLLLSRFFFSFSVPSFRIQSSDPNAVNKVCLLPHTSDSNPNLTLTF